jgi:hypothetical protein
MKNLKKLSREKASILMAEPLKDAAKQDRVLLILL